METGSRFLFLGFLQPLPLVLQGLFGAVGLVVRIIRVCVWNRDQCEFANSYQFLLARLIERTAIGKWIIFKRSFAGFLVYFISFSHIAVISWWLQLHFCLRNATNGHKVSSNALLRISIRSLTRQVAWLTLSIVKWRIVNKRWTKRPKKWQIVIIVWLLYLNKNIRSEINQ